MRMALTAAAALLAVAACSRVPKVETDPGTGRVDVDVERPGAAEVWTATLAPGAGTSTTGTARAEVHDDFTHVRVSISGGPAGTHPWHVHDGQCGDPNAPVVGPASAYPPLNGGTASAEAHLANVELNEAKRYHVNVHASAGEMGTIIACGNLDD